MAFITVCRLEREYTKAGPAEVLEHEEHDKGFLTAGDYDWPCSDRTRIGIRQLISNRYRAEASRSAVGPSSS